MTIMTDLSGENESVNDIGYLKKFAKQMLKNSLFVGNFQEKRFVESLNSYRDVIQIAQDETDFITNLMAVKKRIEQTLIKSPWMGITEPDTIGAPTGYNLWVILQEEVLGKHWYKVKTVEFLYDEIRLKLEIVRPVTRENTPRQMAPPEKSDGNDSFNISLEEIQENLGKYFMYFYKNILTLENFKNSVIFIALLVSTIIAGSVNMIKYMLEYLLKLIRETSNLVRAVTPLLIHLINVTGKLIFGFYHLVVTLFQGKPNQQPVYNSYYNIDPQKLMLPDPRQRYNQYFTRGLPPNKRSGVTITPLDN